MFIFEIGLCTVKLDFFCIILLISILRISSSSNCLQSKQYYDSDKKACLPCKICKPPAVVITTCQIYSDTRCGIPKFIDGKISEVLQETPKKRKKFKSHNEKKQSQNAETLLSEDEEATIIKDCSDLQKTSKKWRKLCKSTRKKKHKDKEKGGSMEHKEEINQVLNKTKVRHKPVLKDEHSTSVANTNENWSTDKDHENYTLYSSDQEEFPLNFSHEEDDSLSQELDSIVKFNISNSDTNFNDNFFYSYVGKIIISTIVIFINVLLIVALVFKIITTCYRNKSKDAIYHYSCNQKLPHPSQKPIKCRFTAVLPTKTPYEYANVDSYLNSLISPTFSTTSCSSNWNNSCAAVLPHPSNEDVYETRGNAISSRTLERDSAGCEPLITSTSSEVVENANMIQLYSRIPSPNPFTMDRLLEHRRAIGCTSVENNLYVETWCSSPSPRLSRSQESSVAPSPALSCIRKTLPSSSSSSPLTTRTFRATPAFTSFHPNRL